MSHIDAIPSQGHPASFFSDKLNESKQKYSTHNKEVYVLYTIGMLIFYKRGLRFIQTIKLLTTIITRKGCGKRLEFIQDYAIVIKLIDNKAVNALSQVVYLITTMSVNVVRLKK